MSLTFGASLVWSAAVERNERLRVAWNPQTPDSVWPNTCRARRGFWTCSPKTTTPMYGCTPIRTPTAEPGAGRLRADVRFAVAAALLAAYHLAVRYTPLGWLLNGRRSRGAARDALTAPRRSSQGADRRGAFFEGDVVGLRHAPQGVEPSHRLWWVSTSVRSLVG